jgi:2-polyprenyl-6-methoxyphenol hydroxylase-like FAD-dependent oxidoreductase
MPTTKKRHPHAGRAHAVVIGGSIAGLLAADVLADHFDRVTLIERDRVSDGAAQRKGVPQARHGHHLLSRGFAIMSRRFPGLPGALTADGAHIVDLGADTQFSRLGRPMVRFRSQMQVPLATRPFLESHVRRMVLERDNLILLEESAVASLLANPEQTRVVGVLLQHREAPGHPITLPADLVVHASGRGSRTPRWLEVLGYKRPDEHTINVDIGYASCRYRFPQGGLEGAKSFFLMPTPPHETRGGVMTQVEGGNWLVTLGGWLGDHPPADEAGFFAFARSLPSPEIACAISHAEPIGNVAMHKFPSSLRRHYERLARFPGGLIVLGDALCSFNPVYGQGMTVAALEAEVLDQCLRDELDDNDLARRFFQGAAQMIETPWGMVAGVDLQYPQVMGARPLGSRLMATYIRRLQDGMMTDPILARAFLEVMQLMRSPASLFDPRIAARVLQAGISRSTWLGHTQEKGMKSYVYFSSVNGRVTCGRVERRA